MATTTGWTFESKRFGPLDVSRDAMGLAIYASQIHGTPITRTEIKPGSTRRITPARGREIAAVLVEVANTALTTAPHLVDELFKLSEYIQYGGTLRRP